nr:MAG TPA: hypothetical protein [Caudoviricetes sp.]
MAGNKKAFEKVSNALHKAQHNNRVKWYMVEFYK